MNRNEPEAEPRVVSNRKPSITLSARLRFYGPWVSNKARRLANLSVSPFVTLLVRTHKQRWRKVARNPEPIWDERNRLIANFIPEGSSVLDIGCGAQSLRRHLKADCKYQPCDLIRSTPDVIVCDFNAGVLPAVSAAYDVVVCSGVFEYIRDPKRFLESVATYGRVVLISYHPLFRGQWKWQRLASNWVNHFAEEQLVKLFADVGLQSEILHGSGMSERIYRLRRPNVRSFHS